MYSITRGSCWWEHNALIATTFSNAWQGCPLLLYIRLFAADGGPGKTMRVTVAKIKVVLLFSVRSVVG